MKRIIYRIIFSIFFILVLLVLYLSIVGIETKSFNNRISKNIKNFNENFEIELKEIKILLDPFTFNVNIKTTGSKLKNKDQLIEIEKIKTQISIMSILNNEFSIKNLEILTKPQQIKKYISFVRTFRNSSDIYILKKITKKGFMTLDLKVEFDSNGKIKNNYLVKGFVKNAQIDILKKYRLDKLNFTFNLKDKYYDFKDIKLSLNNIPFSSNKILIKKLESSFLVESTFKNEEVEIDKRNIELFTKSFFPKLDIKKINFKSKNNISFKIDKKYKIKDAQISSDLGFKKLLLVNNLKLKKIFPKILEDIDLNNHELKIKYDKGNLFIEGNGNIKFQEKNDKIIYSLNKENKKLRYKSSLIIENNPFILELLNYRKEELSKLIIDLDATQFLSQKTIFHSLSLKENKNQIIINDLELNKTFKVKSIQSAKLKFKDKNKIKNELNLDKKKKYYLLSGSSFNADNLIEKMINNENKDSTNFFGKNFKINLDIDKIHLDSEHHVKNLTGNLNIKNNEISKANIIAQFSKNKRMKFTVSSDEDSKISTLFLEKAEPIVRRYKFIKGYEDGSLDFYSSKKGKESSSILKIYDFKLKELPALTKLLTLASLQGIADILSGEGIRFDEFEMNFKSKDDLMTINEIYAIGPAISVLMNGYVEKDKIISLRGTLVPATTINKAIGSIPVLGKILVGSKTGEGVFGVSFKIKGPPKKLETTVNPIKTLTPRFITRTLEKLKKN